MKNRRNRYMKAVLASVLTAIWAFYLPIQRGYAQSAPRNLYFTPIVWSADGSKIAITVMSSVEVRDAQSSVPLVTLKGHDNAVSASSWHPDGTRIATSSLDGTVKLWRVADGALLRTFTGHNDLVVYVEWTPDGNYLVSSGVDVNPNFLMWSPDSNFPVARYKTGTVTMGGFSPDGTRFAYGGSTLLEILDTTNYSQLARYREPICCSNAMNSLRWSNDNTRIVTGSGNGLVTIWDPATAMSERLFMINQYANMDALAVKDAALTWVRDVRFDADGKTVWAVAGDGTVKAWDVATGAVVKQMQLAPLATARWSPYGVRLAVLDASFLPALDGTASAKTTADSGLQVVIPDATFTHLNTLADQCVREGEQTNAAVSDLATQEVTKATLQSFVSTVDALPTDAIPAACKADLLALAEALG